MLDRSALFKVWGAGSDPDQFKLASYDRVISPFMAAEAVGRFELIRI